MHDPLNREPTVLALRDCIRNIDEEVVSCYGWNDIALNHGFHSLVALPALDNTRFTISEPARLEILRRLAALNRERWQQEQQAGSIATTAAPARGAARRRARAGGATRQASLFD